MAVDAERKIRELVSLPSENKIVEPDLYKPRIILARNDRKHKKDVLSQKDRYFPLPEYDIRSNQVKITLVEGNL